MSDYERIENVIPTQLGQFYCPKCKGLCNERSPEKRLYRNVREFECNQCFRGWFEFNMGYREMVLERMESLHSRKTGVIVTL